MILRETLQSSFGFFGRPVKKFYRDFGVGAAVGGVVGCVAGCGLLISLDGLSFILNMPLLILGAVFNADIKMLNLELTPSGVMALAVIPLVGTTLGAMFGGLVEKGAKCINHL